MDLDLKLLTELTEFTDDIDLLLVLDEYHLTPAVF